MSLFLNTKCITIALWFFGVALFFLFLTPSIGHAAVVTWDCDGGDNSWNNDLNWSGDSEPGAGDIATFDATCTDDVNIDKNITVDGIDVNSGYTGTITQTSTYTIDVDEGDWAHYGPRT